MSNKIGLGHPVAGVRELDEAALQRRKDLLGFGEQDLRLLKALHEQLDGAESGFVEDFYAQLLSFEKTRALLADPELVAQLKRKQHAHLMHLTAGEYDLGHVHERLQVGMMYQSIGLKPEWFVGAYGRYLGWLMPEILSHAAGDAGQVAETCLAVMRAVLLDIELSVGAYFQADHEMLRLFAQVFESNLEAVLIVDNAGTILHANKTVTAVMGYAPAEVAGKRLVALHPERQADLCGQILETAAAGGQWQGEIWQMHKNGEEYPAWMNASPVRNDDGTVTHVVVEFSNIADFKQTQEELAKRTEELAHSNQELEQFAYVASHDLQEPLRMVASYTQLLSRRYKDKLDEDANEFIGYAVDGATRMQALIIDLLALSRIGTRGKPLEPCESGMALDRALANLRLAISEAGAVVTHDVMPKLTADVSQLTQLFQNLIGNALKFRGQAAPAVHIGAEQRKREWIFSVRDNGIGIAPEFFERIFVIFQRLHGKKEYPGTGIGLSVCKKIVERHGGKIWIESTPGQGTVFYFTIPIQRGE